jgi:hypothetical protein
MPIEVGIWRMGERPQRIDFSAIETEKRLEDVLASDLGILDPNLLLIGRQVPTAYGKFIDLLAVDREGNVVVIELKKDRTPREVVAQVLDYGSWVRSLEEDDIAGIFEAYTQRYYPARLVCHKSSYFSEAELAGCKAAVDGLEIDSYDLLSMRRSRTRLYRSGAYPPLRGTAVTHSDGALIYTNGSVDFYRCYPGLYTPRMLDIRFDHVEQSHGALLDEVLGLTKMNWNSTEMATFEPVTLDAARGVGSILRYAPADDHGLQARFSFFM